MCSPALNIIPPSSPAGRLFWLLQSDGLIRCSLKSLRMLGYCQHFLPGIRWNWNMKHVNTGLEQSEQSANRTAGWSNVESWTAHYGQHHIQFWTACRAGGKSQVMQILGPLVGVTVIMVPVKASYSNFEAWYLKIYLIRVQNPFSLSDWYFPNKHTVQVLILTLVPL